MNFLNYVDDDDDEEDRETDFDMMLLWESEDDLDFVPGNGTIVE